MYGQTLSEMHLARSAWRIVLVKIQDEESNTPNLTHVRIVRPKFGPEGLIIDRSLETIFELTQIVHERFRDILPAELAEAGWNCRGIGFAGRGIEGFCLVCEASRV